MLNVVVIILGLMRASTSVAAEKDHPNQTFDFERVLPQNASLIVVSPPNVLTTTTSQDVRFRCAPTSFDFNVTWLRLNAKLPPNRTTISDFDQVLTIKNVDITDSDGYKCIVSNGRVTDERTVFLHVHASPFWTYKPEDVILSPGESASITCLASGSPEPEIAWLLNDHLVPTSHTGINDERVYTQGNLLRIKNAQRNDSGELTCLAKNNYGSISMQVYVIVAEVAPKLVSPMEDVEITEGQTAVFVCDVIGASAPHFSWFFNNISITLSQKYILSGNALTVTGVNMSDDGRYRCIATSILGEIIVEASLIVREATTIDVFPPIIAVKHEESAVFRCNLMKNEHLVNQVTWYHNGVAVSKLMCGGSNQNRFQHDNDNSLIFMTVQKIHEGRYECVAKTAFDEAKGEVTLLMKDHPDPPTNVRIIRIGEFVVELAWDPGFDGNSPTNNFFIQYLRSEPYDWMVITAIMANTTSTVMRLDPWTHYTFRIIQTNSIGISPPSSETQPFQTAPLPPTRNPGMVEATLNENGDILITWEDITNGINGPGFYYLLSWRGNTQIDWESIRIPDYTVDTKVIHPTRTSESYDVMVQSCNELGNGPEPTAYSTRKLLVHGI